jgi:hypothetical protein
VKRRNSAALAALLAALAWTCPAPAAAREKCAPSPGNPEVADNAPVRHVLIVVDRTVVFQPAARDRVMKWVHQLIRGDDDVRVYSLSGLWLDEGSALEMHERLKHPLSDQELDENVSTLFRKNARACREGEIAGVRGRLEGEVRQLLSTPVDDRIPSEIVEFFAHLSVADDTAADRRSVIVLLSDMMENSKSFYSFYSPGCLEAPRLRKYLDRLTANGAIGHMHNAKVFVIGAATVPAHGKRLTLPERRNLEQFWHEWFDDSRADLRMWDETYPTREPD